MRTFLRHYMKESVVTYEWTYKSISLLTLHLPETGSALKSDEGEGPNTSPVPEPEAALLIIVESGETSSSIKAGKSLSNVYVD